MLTENQIKCGRNNLIDKRVKEGMGEHVSCGKCRSASCDVLMPAGAHHNFICDMPSLLLYIVSHEKKKKFFKYHGVCSCVHSQQTVME